MLYWTRGQMKYSEEKAKSAALLGSALFDRRTQGNRALGNWKIQALKTIRMPKGMTNFVYKVNR